MKIPELRQCLIQKGVILILTVTICICYLFSQTAAAEVQPGDWGIGPDSWYYDLQEHWGRKYVLTLWREGVTNGYPFVIFEPGTPWSYGYNFEPDVKMDRGQLLYMMSKLFQFEPDFSGPPPWPDLPPSFSLYGRPAYGQIHAAASEWLGDQNYLQPQQRLSRLHAVKFIINALNLGDYPKSLSISEVESLLGPFQDRHSIPFSSRPLVAAAVRLRLLIGYNDSTLRVSNELTRAEASAILYRSCMMRIIVQNTTLSFSSSSHPESTPIDVIGLRNENNEEWRLQITDTAHNLVTRLPKNGPVFGDPHTLTWDGSDESGQSLHPGEYLVGGYLKDRHQQRFEAVPIPVQIINNQLSANVTPQSVEIGQKVLISAETQGQAQEVWVILPNGEKLSASQTGQTAGGHLWEANISCQQSKGFSAGMVGFEVQAVFSQETITEPVQVEILPASVEEPICKNELILILTR